MCMNLPVAFEASQMKHLRMQHYCRVISLGSQIKVTDTIQINGLHFCNSFCQLTCWCKCAVCLGLVPKLPLAVPWVQLFIPPRLLPTGKVICFLLFPQATPTFISLNCCSLLSGLVCISYCLLAPDQFALTNCK